jgi:hypothetical protein
LKVKRFNLFAFRGIQFTKSGKIKKRKKERKKERKKMPEIFC